MKKNILLVLLSTLIFGCSQAPIAPDGSALDDCRRPFPWFCRGNENNAVVTLNTKNKKLKVSPYCIKASAGESYKIRFELKPPGSNAKDTVHIIPKDPVDDSWLRRSNDGDDTDVIEVTILADIDRDRRIYYGVRTDDACVDPRIRVEN
jgi:hypothetical protein